jgi:hypothetical protein
VIFNHPACPQKVEELWKLAQEKWEGSDWEDIYRWIREEMPQCISQVYRKGGGHIQV